MDAAHLAAAIRRALAADAPRHPVTLEGARRTLENISMMLERQSLSRRGRMAGVQGRSCSDGHAERSIAHPMRPNLIHSPLVAVTSYFNPFGYARRLANYRTFRRHLDVPLLTIEWSPSGSFALRPNDAELVVQIRSGDILWQKERLLNIALNQLPPEVEYVAWIDCDLIFDRPNWSEAARTLLERYALIQLFDEAVHLPAFPLEQPLQITDWVGAEPVYRQAGIAAAHSSDGGILAQYTDEASTPLGWLPGMRSAPPPAHGLAWAARRSVLDTCRLYDACVVGGGDSAIFAGAIGKSHVAQAMLQMTEPFAEHYQSWALRLQEFTREAGVGHMKGRVFHLWHGARANRRYRERHALLAAADYDPTRDLERSPEGAWIWSNEAHALRGAVAGYLRSRQEDGPVARG